MSPVEVLRAGVLVICATCGAHAATAPTDPCASVSPAHSAGIPQPNSGSPYKVDAALQTDGTSKVLVTLGSPANTPFKGFSLQARVRGGAGGGGGIPIGTWKFVGVASKAVDCQGSMGAALTNADEVGKQSISATWTPPPGFAGEVEFLATVVQSFETFWVGIKSNPVMIRTSQLSLPRPSFTKANRERGSLLLPPPPPPPPISPALSSVSANRNGLEPSTGSDSSRERLGVAVIAPDANGTTGPAIIADLFPSTSEGATNRSATHEAHVGPAAAPLSRNSSWTTGKTREQSSGGSISASFLLPVAVLPLACMMTVT